jgi:adhesin HecA-like repeat protein
MALGTMLVLTIALTSTIYMTSASQRHAGRANSDQKAYALAESGVNNAMAVLRANYTSTSVYPGDSSLLPPRTTAYSGGSCTAPVDNCVTWSGTLTQTTTGSQWPFQWQITSTAQVRSPDGPASGLVSRTVTAVVPVVISPTQEVSSTNVLNWIYAATNAAFEQGLTIAAPVYAVGDLTLENTARIDSSAGMLAVGGNLTLSNPQNEVGSTSSRIPLAYVEGSCTWKNKPTHTPCAWDTDHVYAAGPGANEGGTAIPAGLIPQVPTLTCCAVPSSQMGFWYRYASPGPSFPCVTSSGSVPQFDNDTFLNNSANGAARVNLTPSGSYSCVTPSGELSWNGSKLTVNGTVYIDGSAYISAGSGTYSGSGTIVLSGTFAMGNNTQMCAVASCSASSWDPNSSALIIVADGDGAGCCGQNQVDSGNSIQLKKATFQGGLIANKNIRIEVNSSVIGPMISVYGGVTSGQQTTLEFPPIQFAPSGTGGITQPPPPGELLSPRDFAG